MKLRLYLNAAIILFSAFFISCSSDDNDLTPEKDKILISKITILQPTEPVVETWKYYPDNKIKTSVIGNFVTRYEYKDNTIHINCNFGTGDYDCVAYLDSKSNITKVEGILTTGKPNDIQTKSFRYDMEYNDRQQLTNVAFTSKVESGVSAGLLYSTAQEWFWEDDNLVSVKMYAEEELEKTIIYTREHDIYNPIHQRSYESVPSIAFYLTPLQYYGYFGVYPKDNPVNVREEYPNGTIKYGSFYYDYETTKYGKVIRRLNSKYFYEFTYIDE